MYRLKKGQDSFKVVDGPFAGRHFKRGVEVAEVPPGEKHRFEKVPEPRKPKPANGEKGETAKKATPKS